MSNKTPVNIAASVLARLKNLAVQRGWNFMHMLTRYGIERFLFRLGASEYARQFVDFVLLNSIFQFVLKGGNMFVIWQNGNNSRPTIDSDLLCYGVVPARACAAPKGTKSGNIPPAPPTSSRVEAGETKPGNTLLGFARHAQQLGVESPLAANKYPRLMTLRLTTSNNTGEAAKPFPKMHA